MIKYIVLGWGIIFLVALVAVMILGRMPQKSSKERIEEGCAREYASGSPEAIQRCQITLFSRELERIDDQQLKEANR